jgi:hypothetical protein
VVVDRDPREVVEVVHDLSVHVELDALERVDALDREHLLEDRLDLLVDLLEEPEEQVFLGLDVVVQAALEDAELVGDVLHRRGRVATLVEDLGGRGDDLVIALAPRPRGLAGCSVRCFRHAPSAPSPARSNLPIAW